MVAGLVGVISNENRTRMTRVYADRDLKESAFFLVKTVWSFKSDLRLMYNATCPPIVLGKRRLVNPVTVLHSRLHISRIGLRLKHVK